MLVKYCSPVLAGIKTANMFTFFDELSNILNIIESYNNIFNSFGIFFFILNSCEKSSLIYVYRPDKLAYDLKQNKVYEFMSSYGYDVENIDACIEILSSKIKNQKDFPHEIGLFLSYPIYDVLGFIENKGSNFICCGCWKVYYNEENAKRIFYKYKKCTNIFCKRFNVDRNLFKLVAK